MIDACISIEWEDEQCKEISTNRWQKKEKKIEKPNYKHIYSRSNESHKNQKTYKH